MQAKLAWGLSFYIFLGLHALITSRYPLLVIPIRAKRAEGSAVRLSSHGFRCLNIKPKGASRRKCHASPQRTADPSARFARIGMTRKGWR
jgi:hypothetical protein